MAGEVERRLAMLSGLLGLVRKLNRAQSSRCLPITYLPRRWQIASPGISRTRSKARGEPLKIRHVGRRGKGDRRRKCQSKADLTAAGAQCHASASCLPLSHAQWHISPGRNIFKLAELWERRYTLLVDKMPPSLSSVQPSLTHDLWTTLIYKTKTILSRLFYVNTAENHCQ
jgi:hypothetical protein